MQVGLLRPATVDQLKADMLAGRFEFAADNAKISGYRDTKGTYHINDGNHRLVAALEIFRETGEDAFVQMLLACGSWASWDRVPVGSRPMPSRRLWGKLRNRLGL
jgi:filamentous hemagglutinin